MKYAILNWMDGSMTFFQTKDLAIDEFDRQLKEHKETVRYRDKFDEFDKMVIEIINQHNSIDK
jgi:hypothetical protein